MQTKQYYVYIAKNKLNTVLYTGVTNNLKRRIYEHKNKIGSNFSAKYNINKLVYFEIYNEVTQAISREKQIKAGSRKKKTQFVEGKNPEWKDLSLNF
jgi:putative endonuclease